MVKPIRNLILSLICAIGLQFAQAQSFNTKGVDFWFGFMENLTNSGLSLDVYISSEYATSGTIDIPLSGWSTTFTVVPGTATKVILPITYMASGSEVIAKEGIHLVSNDTVSVFAMNYRSASFDAAMVMPMGSIGDEYMVISYEGYSTSSYPSQFLIVATADNTVVEITPSVTTKGGKTAKVPFTVTLNKGETYPVQANSNSDLSGSTIKSYNGVPIAVFTGVMCAKINTCTYCDHIFEELFPVDTWGENYILVPLKSRKEDTYRVIAKENGTSVTINGSTMTLNAGQYYEFDVKQSVSTLDASCPVSVAQYCQGYSCDNIAGDPFILMIAPNEQMVTEATFEEIGTSNINDFYINVVVKTSGVSNVTLDGTNISSSFSSVSGNTNYSYAQLSTSSGTHTLKADSGFLAYVYGLGYVESYGYVAAASFRTLTTFDIVFNGDTIDYALFNDTICPGETISFEGYSDLSILSWEWYFGDGASDTGKYASHTYPAEGNYDLQLVFQKDNGCTIEMDTLTAQLTVEGPSIAFIVSDETCSQANGMAIAQLSDSSIQATYSWNTNPVQNNDTATALSAGNYEVTISYGVCKAVDTLTINNLTTFTIQMDSINEFCSLANGMAYVTPSVSGSYTYSWNTNPVQLADTAYNLSAGTYTVNVEDGSCLVIDSIVITDTPAPDLALNSIDETCNLSNGIASVSISGGNPPYTINWNTNPVQTTDSASSLSTGYYIVTVSDSFCTVVDSVYVNALPVLVTSDFSYDQQLTTSGQTQADFVSLALGADSVLWDFGDGTSSSEENPIHIYSDTGMYAIQMISYDANGCTDTLLQYILIEEPFNFFIPNAFTPDADGINDSFSGSGIGITFYKMIIHDRWGNKIYETNEINKPWDGKMQSTNEAVQDGVYLYTINVIDIWGENNTYRGSITLIR
jgi:gliding motility-associated-like protein